MLSVLSDETADPFDTCDGAKGYLNRWAGMGSPGYECGADFLVAEFTEYGYDNVERHRFQYIEGNPEAYNISAHTKKVMNILMNGWLLVLTSILRQ